MTVRVLSITLLALGFAACQKAPIAVAPKPVPPRDETTLRPAPILAIKDEVRGAGSTFAEPVYNLWFAQYKPNLAIHFYYNEGETPGSEDGVKKLLHGQLHFAGSDWPLTEAEESDLARPYASVAHLYVPAIIGAVVPVFSVRDINHNDIPRPLRFTSQALAGIYSGTVLTWDNPEIQGVNRSVRLPHASINLIVRSDGSGSTYIFSTFLKKKGGWTGQPGMKVAWPRYYDTAAGSLEMADKVKNTGNSVGYVEYTYAVSENTKFGSVLTHISPVSYEPDIYQTPNAANMVASVPRTLADNPVLNPISLANALLDTADPQAYPISSVTWFVTPVPTEDMSRNIFRGFLCWMLQSGQIPARSIGYAQLPSRIRSPAKRAVEGYFGSCPT